jgi:hypothetical protein
MPNRMRDRNECHSVLNERQIAKALFEGRLVPGCRQGATYRCEAVARAYLERAQLAPTALVGEGVVRLLILSGVEGRRPRRIYAVRWYYAYSVKCGSAAAKNHLP